VDNTRDYARVSHSRQWSRYNKNEKNSKTGSNMDSVPDPKTAQPKCAYRA